MPDHHKLTKEELIERIQSIYETDIGDFKRRVALYLNRFSQNQNKKELKKQIQEIKNFSLYIEVSSENQMKDIDKLRIALLEKLENL